MAATEGRAFIAKPEPQIVVKALDVDRAPSYVIYGAYIASGRNRIPDPELRWEATRLRDSTLATLVSDPGVLYLSKLGRMKVFRSNGRQCAFAAVLRTELPVTDDLEAPALTLFACREEVSLEQNFLSRLGVLAVKSGVRLPDGLSGEALDRFVDRALDDKAKATEAAAKAFHIGLDYLVEPHFVDEAASFPKWPYPKKPRGKKSRWELLKL